MLLLAMLPPPNILFQDIPLFTSFPSLWPVHTGLRLQLMGARVRHSIRDNVVDLGQ